MKSDQPAAGEPVLSIRNLVTEFVTDDGIVHAVNDVSYDLYPGETLGVVGESGSGKSVTVMSVLGLIPQPPGRIVGGQVLFNGRDLLKLSEREMRRIRGRQISVVFQDPMSSLNPVLTVGHQISEALIYHNRNLSKAEIRRRGIGLLDTVGVPNSAMRYGQYPHEFSGGMRQRAMIAIAMANRPRVLIADEPTTALDVTIQAQVLEVLKTAQNATNAGTILITHDLGLIAELADRVVVMYAGRIAEIGPVREVFHNPRHPYTLGLMASLPRIETELEEVLVVPGQPPSLISVPTGCAFHPRCQLSQGRERCRREIPDLPELGPDNHRSACHYAEEMPELTQTVSQEIGVRLGGPQQ